MVPSLHPFVSRRVLLAGLTSLIWVQGVEPADAEAPLRSIRPSPRPGRRPVRHPAGTAGVGKVEFGPAAASAAALIEAAKLGGTVGFAVADAATGLVLESRDATVGLPPASVMKTITTAYALDRLGADFRFSTRLIATGPVEGGRIRGDLVLAGGGDPTLDTDMLGDMAAALGAQGVRGVTGRFRVYGGALPFVRAIDPGQEDHLGYNPAVAGLNLNFNRVHFEWTRGADGYAVAMDARAERFRPAVARARMRIVDRSLPVYTYDDRGDAENWTVARSALGKAGSRWLPVRHPDLYAGDVFQALARAQGIDLPDVDVLSQPPRGDVLVRRQSARLYDVMRDMMKFSNNLTAEAVGLSASSAPDLAASAGRMQAWAGDALGLRTARLTDHSGLGAGSRISADEMLGALLRLGGQGAVRGLLKPFALRDSRGRVVRNHPVSVAAKTGTLNFVSALAGFARLPDGADVAFAIFCADPARRDRVPEGSREAPEGGAAWTRRARHLQQQLIERWSAVYGS